MSKKNNYKPGIRTREMLPLATRTKDGHIILMCPFCVPSHALTPESPSPCGTKLHVTAVQKVISARTARQEGLVCVKCREKGGGEMVKYLNGYIHLKDCAPGVRLLTEVPKYSRTAKFVFKLPEKLRGVVEKHTGVVQMVHELTPEGQETGQIQGYFFKKAVQNG